MLAADGFAWKTAKRGSMIFFSEHLTSGRISDSYPEASDLWYRLRKFRDRGADRGFEELQANGIDVLLGVWHKYKSEMRGATCASMDGMLI